MIALFASFALAAPPPHADGEPVPAEPTGVVVEWAQPLALSQPIPYRWVAGAPSREAGWILQLRVDPSQMTPRQVGGSVFYLGTTPIAIVNADTRGGCAVGYVLGAGEPATLPVYIGSPELPERIDDAAGSRELAAAMSRGAAPRAPLQQAPLVNVSNLEAVYAILADRVLACAPHESETIATLRAQSGQ